MSTENSSTPNTTNTKKLGVIALAGLVISAMIGGGIFNLPQNMSQSASAGAVGIAWIITGIGMYFLTNTFRVLSTVVPDAKSGIYSYARLGFGKFVGFLMAWGYWLSAVFANVGYAILLMDSLNYFFLPHFKGGNNLPSVIGGSILIWAMYFMIMAGVRQATSINTIGTIAKLVPIALFILVSLFVFKISMFHTNFWGDETIKSLHDVDLGSLGGQIKSTMLVTLWSFIGIEGAVVISDRAESQAAVSKATLIGFLLCLLSYMAISMLPFGNLSQGELSVLAPPSTAPILADVVGKWGSWFMNIGVIIALLSSWLVWTVLLAELPYACAKDGTFPKIFAKVNKNGTPSFSLLVSSIAMQITMIFVYFASNAWNVMLSITGVMILPAYIASTLYLWKISATGQFPKNATIKEKTALITGVLGSIYGAWLIYAAGLKYLVMASILFAIGILVFDKARKENKAPNESVFTNVEKILAIGLIIIAIIALFLLITKRVSL
ncbi:MAG: amino acid permease [Fusobacterium sp.]|nr:amino acid permease [Fusobacterium sp.]